MNIENAKEILLGFMQEMYEWEKKATKSLRSLDYENTLRLELSMIFSKYCTPKKTREHEKYHFQHVFHLNINQKRILSLM